MVRGGCGRCGGHDHGLLTRVERAFSHCSVAGYLLDFMDTRVKLASAQLWYVHRAVVVMDVLILSNICGFYCVCFSHQSNRAATWCLQQLNNGVFNVQLLWYSWVFLYV